METTLDKLNNSGYNWCIVDTLNNVELHLSSKAVVAVNLETVPVPDIPLYLTVTERGLYAKIQLLTKQQIIAKYGDSALGMFVKRDITLYYYQTEGDLDCVGSLVANYTPITPYGNDMSVFTKLEHLIYNLP